MISSLLAALSLSTLPVQAAPATPQTPPAIVELDIRSAADFARLAAVGGESLACEVRPGRQQALVPPDAVPVLEAAGLAPVVVHPDAHAASQATRDRALATLARGDADWWADY
jgi:hypothetical protein